MHAFRALPCPIMGNTVPNRWIYFCLHAWVSWEQQAAIQDIVSLCVKRNFDGLVLEMNPLTPDRLTWLESLGAEMHSTQSRRGVVLKLIVVLPPTRIHNGHPHGGFALLCGVVATRPAARCSRRCYTQGWTKTRSPRWHTL